MSLRSTIIACANAVENWEIEHLINSISLAINKHNQFSVDVSNLGIEEAEILYGFLTTLRNHFNCDEWNAIGAIADELVRFHGSPFLSATESSEILTKIWCGKFNDDIDEDDDEYLAYMEHERVFPQN